MKLLLDDYMFRFGARCIKITEMEKLKEENITVRQHSITRVVI